jgi:putative proteasome-type protease
MTVFERPGDRVIVMLSSGGLASTQAIVSVLKQRCAAADETPSPWNAGTMFDVARLISDATRDVELRSKQHSRNALVFNASFIFGGQIKGEPMRLFRTYAETNQELNKAARAAAPQSLPLS